MKQKTLDELTIKNNFMFGAVMSENENCRKLLEMILGISIDYVEISKEKSTDYTELPKTFVIFICDFDPFGLKKYRYWFRSCCAEVKDLILEEKLSF